ncbi:hypothetical protein V0N53_004600 [Salmonella enterica]|nr:hypothetical protein [Salmonella enterica]
MANNQAPSWKNPTPAPGVKMMPEGSRKVCVLNGSRQIDQVIKGEWTTLKVLPESGLPKGIFYLGEATIQTHERIRLAGNRQAPKETAGGCVVGLGQLGGSQVVAQLAQLGTPCPRLSQLLEHMSSY